MTFRNNLTPGLQTKHRILRTIRRSAPRKNYLETLVYQKSSDWVRCNVDESKPGTMKIYQMMDDRKTKILKFFEGKLEHDPPPTDPSQFNLTEGSTTLFDAVLTPTEGAYLVPHTESAERAILAMLLDFEHWPRKRIDAGHRWERDIVVDGFTGTQSFEFIDLVKYEDQSAARVTVQVQGEFSQDLATDFVFRKAEAVIYWGRMDRVLLKMDGRASYERKRLTGNDEFDLGLLISLKKKRVLSEAAQESMVNQLTAFASAWSSLQQGAQRDAARGCENFEQRWPGSVWMPAVREMSRRAVRSQNTAGRISTKELEETLSKSIVAWDAARTEMNYDMLERTEQGMAAVAGAYRSKLKSMVDDGGDVERAKAVFALAFGSRPADLALVHKAAQDAAPVVRSMAAAGLAARRRHDADTAVVARLLRDDDPGVRRRACQAAAACILPEDETVGSIVERLHIMIAADEVSLVREEAAQAIAFLGAPVDVDKLKSALEKEKERTVRAALRKAIGRLRGGSEADSAGT